MAIRVNPNIVSGGTYTGNYSFSASTNVTGFAVAALIRVNNNITWPQSSGQNRPVKWLNIGAHTLGFAPPSPGSPSNEYKFYHTVGTKKISQVNPVNSVFAFSQDNLAGEWYHILFKVRSRYEGNGVFRAKYAHWITSATSQVNDYSQSDLIDDTTLPYSDFDYDTQLINPGFNQGIGYNLLGDLGTPYYQGTSPSFPDVSVDRFWFTEIVNDDQFNALQPGDFIGNNGVDLIHTQLPVNGTIDDITPQIYTYGDMPFFWANKGTRNNNSVVFNSTSSFVSTSGPIVSVTGETQLAVTSNVTALGNKRHPGSAILQASSNLIVAPGEITLIESSINSDFSTEAEYIDITYFDDIYVGSFLNATLTLGGTSNLQSSSNITAQGNILYSFNADLASDSELIAQPGYLIQGQAELNNNVVATSVASNIYNGQSYVECLASVSASGGRIYAIDSEISSDVNSVPTAGMIYDIGMQYAIDWVDPNEDYVQPYYYLGLRSQFDIYGLPIVVKQMEASVSAEFNLDAVAGFLKQIDGALNSDSSINAVTGVIIASTGAATESDFSSLISGGRVYNIDEAMAFDFTADFQGNRNIDTTYDFRSDSTVDLIVTLFSGARSFMFSDFETLGTGGYFLGLPLQHYYSDFNVAPVFAKIITLDEYYIDLIVPETRQLFIAIEPRLIQALSETRQINIHEDPTTMIINSETRINKPEVGRSYLVGQRTRRIAA